LVDATYEPLDELRRGSKRDEMMTRDYHLLRDDLASLLPDRSAPLILIKENVCRLLEARLREDVLTCLTPAESSTFRAMGSRKIFIGSSLQS
jgi:hypothetical protein